MIFINLSAIQFELEQFGILRLDDHVDNLHISLYGDDQVYDKPLVENLLNKLQQIDLSKLVIAQCLFKYQDTLDFYAIKPNLRAKALVFGEDRNKILYIFKLIGDYDKLTKITNIFKRNASEIDPKQMKLVINNIKVTIRGDNLWQCSI